MKEEPSYMMFAKANVRDKVNNTPAAIVEALLQRIERLEKAAEQEDLTVYGYCVVDRDGKFIKNADSQQQAIDFAADSTDSCKEAGIDWDYRVAAIVDMGGL